MKIAIFGDIHANLEGLEAVLEDANSQECDMFCCIGDLVGYNANPSECLNLVRDMGCPVVKGNHDEDCSIDSSLDGLNPLAKASLEWTRQVLSEEEKSWLRDLKYIRPVRNFTIVHSSLDSPESWTYVKNRFEANMSFNYQSTQLCFFGHTHVPIIYAKSNAVLEVNRSTLPLEFGKKYFVNVGSCGQPRDGIWQASYGIFDVDNRKVTLRRVDYDIEKAQEKIISAGLPRMLAERLKEGR